MKTLATEYEVRSRGLWSDAWRQLRKRKLVMGCLAIITAYAFAAVLVYAGILADDWNETVGEGYQPPSLKHPSTSSKVIMAITVGAPTSLRIRPRSPTTIAVSSSRSIPLMCSFSGRFVADTAPCPTRWVELMLV